MNAPAQPPQNIADVLNSDANDQVGALHRKWVSPVELVDAAIARAQLQHHCTECPWL
jgi:hypothetical protein